MQAGNISNEIAPVILVDAELLLDVETKWFGLKRTITTKPGAVRVLHRFATKDVYIYIVVQEDSKFTVQEAQEALDDGFVPYNNIHRAGMDGIWLFRLLEHPRVYYYFHNRPVQKQSYTFPSKEKHQVVETVDDIPKWF